MAITIFTDGGVLRDAASTVSLSSCPVPTDDGESDISVVFLIFFAVFLVADWCVTTWSLYNTSLSQ